MIKYRAHYKYALHERYRLQTEFRPEHDIRADFINLTRDGMLEILPGYAWDGPSGPVLDTPGAMRSSLVHDALYQLLRQEYLPQSDRKLADQLFRDISIEDGVWKTRAWSWYLGLRALGKKAANPSSRKHVYTAP